MDKPKKPFKRKVTEEMISKVMQELGSRGGSVSVPKGVSALSPKERSKRGKEAAKKRWDKVRAEQAKKGG